MKTSYLPFLLLFTLIIFGSLLTKDILKHKQIMKALEVKLQQATPQPLTKKIQC